MDARKARWFQRELNKIVGVEPNGVERFKLVWLPQYEVWDPYRGEMRIFFTWGKPKIEYKAHPGTGILAPRYIWTGVPRYALLGFTGQYTPLELQRAGSELDDVRVFKRPDGLLEFEEVRTDYHATPHAPQYRVEMIFAEHVSRLHPDDPLRPCCMERAFNFDRGYDKCYGKYVEPDEEDLNVVRREMKEYEELFRQSPSGQITDAQFSWIRRTEAEAKAAERLAEEAEREYAVKHHLNALHKAMERAIRSSRSTSLPTFNAAIEQFALDLHKAEKRAEAT